MLEPRLALTWITTPPSSIPAPTNALSVTLNSQTAATGAAIIATTEVDYYAFTATISGSYTLSAKTPSSGVDTLLAVFDAGGHRVAYNDDILPPQNTDSQLTDSQLIVNLIAGARYFVGITNHTASSRGAYTWSIAGPTPSTDDAYESNNTLATATDLGALWAKKTLSSLVMADGQDWFRFITTAKRVAASSVSISFQYSQGNLQLASTIHQG